MRLASWSWSKTIGLSVVDEVSDEGGKVKGRVLGAPAAAVAEESGNAIGPLLVNADPPLEIQTSKAVS